MSAYNAPAEVSLTRVVSFSAGHRYWLSHLSEAENRQLFGVWASPYNHGHNYVLSVTCCGQVDPASGMVVNIKEIDDILQQLVVQQFDQKSINDQVEFFRDKSPSLENMLSYIRSLLNSIPLPARLSALKIEETPLLFGEWSERMLEKTLTITRVYEFAAAHRLHSPGLSEVDNLALFGKCNNPAGHGHNYVLEVTVGGEPDAKTGMIVDIEALDRIVNAEVVDRFDHKNLNQDLPEFEGKNPTSEVVAIEIFNKLRNAVPAKLKRVRLHETARNTFEVNDD